jgi:Flp pilus assembly protein TadG
MRTRRNKQRGAALIETAITIPIILLVSVAIFEFGRAYQTWQVLTNAAREGARVGILAATTDDSVRAAVRSYMDIGGLPLAASDTVTINVERNVPLGPSSGSRITIAYPFNFMVLGPIMALVNPGGAEGGGPITMGAVAIMRNEG